MDNVVIYANKVSSPGYNGVIYRVNKTGSLPTSNLQISLNYTSSTVQWAITRQTGGGTAIGSPTSGAWTTSPGTAYEFMMTGTYVTTGTPLSGTHEGIPVGTWTPISGSTLLARARQPSTSAQGDNEYNFTIRVRKVGTTTPEIVTSVTFAYEYAA